MSERTRLVLALRYNHEGLILQTAEGPIEIELERKCASQMRLVMLAPKTIKIYRNRRHDEAIHEPDTTDTTEQSV